MAERGYKVEPHYRQPTHTRIEMKPEELLVTRSKNGKPRIIPLTSTAQRIAALQIADATTKIYLFTSKRTGGMIVEIKCAESSAQPTSRRSHQ